MPLYDYTCTSCKRSWEEFSSINNRTDPEAKPCPECHEQTVKQQITGTKIVAGVNLQSKVPQGFKDVLKKVKKAHPLNKIDGELS